MNKGFAIATILLVLMAAISAVTMSTVGSAGVADQMKSGLKMVFEANGETSTFYAKSVDGEIKVQNVAAEADGSASFVTEVFGGKSYTYSLANTDALKASLPDDVPERADTVAAYDQYAGIKDDCTVSDATVFSDVSESTDASGNIVVGGALTFTKSADGYGSVSFTGEDGAVTTFNIVSIGPIPAAEAAGLFGGCSAARALEQHAEAGRRLRELNIQGFLSASNWCGAGTDLTNTPCPGVKPNYWHGQYDTEADYACMRHDHGKKAAPALGGIGVKLGCDIDHGIAARTDNWAAQTIFGAGGLAGGWGCFDINTKRTWYNTISCGWRGCRGSAGWRNERREYTRYGPYRYCSNWVPTGGNGCNKNYAHNYGWKPQSRCYNPLPWGAGQI